jgi:hypothetical protein
MPSRYAFVSAAILAFAPAAAAQEVIGEIAATLAGQNRVWQTLQGSGEVSYNTWVNDMGFAWEVNIQGYVEGGSRIAEVLAIHLSGMAGEHSPQTANILYAPERMSQVYVVETEEDAPDILTLDRLEIGPDGGVAAGRFASTLCFKESLFAEPDPDACLDVEGRFETALPRRQ